MQHDTQTIENLMMHHPLPDCSLFGRRLPWKQGSAFMMIS